MNAKTRTLLAVAVLLVTIGCDQATKAIAKRTLPRHEVIRLLGDTVRLEPAENTGAFLSFGSGIPPAARYLVFTILVGLFLAGMLLYVLASGQLTRPQVLAMSLVLGGGFGNLIDRLCHQGRVFDFLNVGIGWLRTGIFNVADLAITSGVLWFLFLAARAGRAHSRRRE